MRKLKVNIEDDGKKLTTYLTKEFKDLKINEIYKALRKKDIKINEKRINQNVNIDYGDEIEVYISDDILLGIKNLDIKKVYEDENIVVFNKPKNLEIEGENSLTEIEKKNYKYLNPVHRIDRNTTGLVIYAKNEESLNELIEMFKNDEIEKHYIALCYGIPKQNATCSAYLFKESKKKIVYISKEPKKGYSKIITSYKLVKEDKNKNISILDVNLHTGKTHQIRAHLAFLGLPIIGDRKIWVL